MSEIAAIGTTALRVNDHVRLLDKHGEIPSGTRGHILGAFGASTDLSYIVSFEGEIARVADVRSDQIVLVHDVRASA